MTWHWWYWGFVVALIGLFLQNVLLYRFLTNVNRRLTAIELRERRHYFDYHTKGVNDDQP